MVKRRFPGREAAVACAFEGGGSFRGLCRDYLTCLAALERWQASESEEAPARSAEYSRLLAELAREIEARLDADRR